MRKNDNSEILEKIEELTATNPEEEYQKNVEVEEAEDPEELEDVRKKLMLMINIKCKGIGPDIINSQVKPMVYKMNVADCKSMTEIIKKKGMYGLPLMLKKRVKHM